MLRVFCRDVSDEHNLSTVLSLLPAINVMCDTCIT